MYVPKRSLDRVLELEVAGLPVVRDGHHVHVRVVELHPGDLDQATTIWIMLLEE